jgi:signal transduction histidine kinase
MRRSRVSKHKERFPDFLESFSTRFARISHQEIDAEIEGWLAKIGFTLDLDRSTIGEFQPETGDFAAVYLWTRDGFPPAPPYRASEVIPWIAGKVRSGAIVAVRGADYLPAEAERDRQFMSGPIGPRSVLVIPLIIGDRVVGGITFADMHGERVWRPALIRRLKVVADILANALERKRSAMENNRLREQLRKASQANLVGEMAAAIAHELSHPLGAILANAQAARRMVEKPRLDLCELTAALDDVISGERRAADYIERVRTIFKRSQINAAPQPVQKVLDSAASLMRSDLQATGIALVIEVEPDLPLILADRVGVEQVLINLLRNAADAILEGNGSPRRITVRACAGGPSQVEIAIADTGPGVDPKILPRLFEPLFTTKESGTGLGLAISQSIVRSHGGNIQVRSEPAGGATFSFTVPTVNAR